MTERARKRMFFVAAPVFFGAWILAIRNLPPFGYYRGPYGDVIARVGVYERHATDVVNAINYDYRGFDTLGEEFILFTAAVGVMMLLRREEGVGTRPLAPDSELRDRATLGPSVRLTALLAMVLTIVLGFYIGLHGALTPGGGFQGGVIMASALLLAYLAENTEAFKRVTSHTAVEVVEAIGAGAYALIALAPLCLGLPLMTNWLPLGKTGDVLASGNIALISATVGVEVTAAFLIVLYTYLQEIVTGQVPEE